MIITYHRNIKLLSCSKSILKHCSLVSIPLNPHHFFLDHCDNLFPMHYHKTHCCRKDLFKIQLGYAILNPYMAGHYLKKKPKFLCMTDKGLCSGGSIYLPNMHQANCILSIPFATLCSTTSSFLTASSYSFTCKQFTQPISFCCT